MADEIMTHPPTHKGLLQTAISAPIFFCHTFCDVFCQRTTAHCFLLFELIIFLMVKSKNQRAVPTHKKTKQKVVRSVLPAHLCQKKNGVSYINIMLPYSTNPAGFASLRGINPFVL